MLVWTKCYSLCCLVCSQDLAHSCRAFRTWLPFFPANNAASRRCSPSLASPKHLGAQQCRTGSPLSTLAAEAQQSERLWEQYLPASPTRRTVRWRMPLQPPRCWRASLFGFKTAWGVWGTFLIPWLGDGLCLCCQWLLCASFFVCVAMRGTCIQFYKGKKWKTQRMLASGWDFSNCGLLSLLKWACAHCIALRQS